MPAAAAAAVAATAAVVSIILFFQQQQEELQAVRNFRKASMMFVFGDSTVDVGNNNFIQGSVAVANSSPYGCTTFHAPTGRFSDGKIMPDFIADFLGISSAPPFLQPRANFARGINFASAGSGILNSTDAALKVIPLESQVASFVRVTSMLRERIGEYRSRLLLSTALVLVSTGSDDVLNNLLRAGRRDVLPRLMSSYRLCIQQLYHAGARRIVVFEVGPLGCAPLFRHRLGGSSCLKLANEMSASFNLGLRLLVVELSRALPGIRMCFAKAYSVTSLLLRSSSNNGSFSSSSTGLANTADACCGECGGRLATRGLPGLCSNPAQFFFWDYIHPTEYAYALLSRYFWDGNRSFIEPRNIRALSST